MGVCMDGVVTWSEGTEIALEASEKSEELLGAADAWRLLARSGVVVVPELVVTEIWPLGVTTKLSKKKTPCVLVVILIPSLPCAAKLPDTVCQVVPSPGNPWAMR